MVFAGEDPEDLIGVEECRALGGRKQDSLGSEEHLRWLRFSEQLREPLNTEAESLGTDGFEQVVKSAMVVGVDGVVVMSGDHDNANLGVEVIEQLKAGSAWHLNVEEDDVDGVIFEQRLRLGHAAGGAHDLYGGKRGEKVGKPADCRVLVINKECADHSGFTVQSSKKEIIAVFRVGGCRR